MTRVTLRAQALLVALAGVVALVLATAHAPTPGSVLAALAASTLAAAVILVAQRTVAVPIERQTFVGQRARTHAESLSRIAEPSHPDSAGRVRSRAPGGMFSAA
ncbi:MAG: hypothetical protein ABI435_01240 [Pseudolysinimonas sp.]